MQTDTKENLKAAFICVFFGTLIWVSGAYAIALVAFGCGIAVVIIPLLKRKFWEDEERIGREAYEKSRKPLPWYLSPIMLPFVVLIGYIVFYVVAIGVDIYQCYGVEGRYDFRTLVCR